jgi:hypothetical protein
VGVVFDFLCKGEGGGGEGGGGGSKTGLLQIMRSMKYSAGSYLVRSSQACRYFVVI